MTTLKQRAEVRADGCAPERYIDAQHIPYFVLPGRPFGDIDVGDVVVGHFKVGVLERLVFAIAADTGPFDKLGEGSIAFNQKLLGSPDRPFNMKSAYALDISLAKRAAKRGEPARLAVLILGGNPAFV